MAFHRIGGHLRNDSYPVDGLPLHELQRDADTLFVGEELQSVVEVYFQITVDVAAIHSSHGHGIDIGGLAATSQMIVEHVISNAEEPCEERRLALEPVDVGICLDERVLREIVAQLTVAQSLREKESPHGRLVLPHQLVERTPIMEYRHLCDQTDVL